ncbi:unnamed protein product, partial [Brassica oleracea var. botrytis]
PSVGPWVESVSGLEDAATSGPACLQWRATDRKRVSNHLQQLHVLSLQFITLLFHRFPMGAAFPRQQPMMYNNTTQLGPNQTYYSPNGPQDMPCKRRASY